MKALALEWELVWDPERKLLTMEMDLEKAPMKMRKHPFGGITSEEQKMVWEITC